MAPRRPMRPVIGAGLLPRLLPIIISALLLLRPAHAGWGGVDNRNDPRLAVKEPGSTRQVAPGQQFSVAITVKKARHRLPALFEVVLPDGALFVGPTGHADERASKTKGFKGRTPAPTSEFGWKAKRAAAKRFPLPDAVINGTAGERTLQWHLDTFKPRHNPIKLTFEADFCGCPSPLEIRLLWQQGGRSARPAVITLNVSPSVNAPAAPETFVDWNAPVPAYESLLLIACHRPDPANPGVCLECINDPAWALHNGRCICAVGAGTHLTATSSAAGWSTTPPTNDGGCREREMHPGLAKGSYGPLSCDATNPRVAEAIFIDPPVCTCRLCPEGYTSDGGNPAQAACFPAAGTLQAMDVLFGFEEEAPAAGGRRLTNAPSDVLDAANALATAWAQALSHVPESLLGALEPIADFTLDGLVSVLESLSVGDQQPYLFSARYVFHASEASRDAVVQAINGVVQDPASNCASWVAYTGVDMCALVQQALPAGYRLVNPWAKPLPAVADASDGRLMQSPSTGAAHRALWITLFTTLGNFATYAFTGIGTSVDDYRRAKKEGGSMTWTGKANIAFGAFQTLGFVFGAFGFGQEQDAYLPYLQQIEETTRETLDRVKDLQVQIGSVQTQLNEISAKIDRVLAQVEMGNCLTLNSPVLTETDKIAALWKRYHDGRTSMLGTAISLLEDMTKDPTDAQKRLMGWATEVFDTVHITCDAIHRRLMDGGGLQGAITVCGQAFLTAWRLDKSVPLDDRQYYDSIVTYLSDKIAHQANAAQMIQDAYLLLAMDEVNKRAKSRNESLVPGVFAEQSNVCNLIIDAYNQNTRSTLAAGYDFCVDRSDRTAKIYDNIVAQIELMGMPLSNGGKGEGVRLLLGSDVTTMGAVLVNDTSDPKNQNLRSSNVQTRWLLPASLGAFDARCANQHDVAQADAARCPAVGTFRSCPYGCNLDPTREARWPRDKYVLGYWGGDWTVAGGAAWEELRGLLTGWMEIYNKTAAGDGADVLALLDHDFPFPNTYHFVGMTNRPFWIVNKTAAVQISDLAIDVIPKYKTWTFDNNINRRLCDYSKCKAADDYKFPWQPRDMWWPEAQCLAAYNPSEGTNTKPRRAGMTGVHCTSNDFSGLFKQWCKRNEPYCGRTHTFCNTTIKPELLQRFGAALQPSNGKKGNLSAACRWDRKWLVDTKEYNLYGGSCHLGPPANPQPALHGYGLQQACEGIWHPNEKGRFPSKYWQNTDIACAPEFSYAWFPELWYKPKRDSPARQKVQGWSDPTDSATRPMFRLPVLDINKIQCTPSPFVNVKPPGNGGKKPRDRRNFINLPTLCNDEMTQAVISLVGPGYYEADAGSSYAELKLANDGDTITCNATWDHATTPGVFTTNVYITVRDGPVYDTDSIDFTGNDSLPLWSSSHTDLYFNATRQGSAPPQPTRTGVSLRAALPRNRTSSATRVVGCTVVGEDPKTRLPITVFAMSKIAVDGALPWRDFEYPIRTKPCTTTGCISTAASGLSDGGGPGLLLAAGPATYLPGAGNRDVLFVRVQGSPTGLLQVMPVANATHNVTEAIYSETSVVPPQFFEPKLIGWQISANRSRGTMYIAGRSGQGITDPAIARLDYSWSNGTYALAAQVPPSRTGSRKCIGAGASSLDDFRFYDITSAWVHPVSEDVFVVEHARCESVYRIEAAMFTSCGNCGRIHHVASYGPIISPSSSESIDQGPIVGQNSRGLLFEQVTLVGDPTSGLLYVALSYWCRVESFNLTTGAYMGLVAGSPQLTDNTGNCGFSGDNGPGRSARLSNDLGQMDVAPNGDLYITDAGNHRVRRVERATGIITTVAGDGRPWSLGDLAQAVNASLNDPRGVKYMEVSDPNVAGGVRRLLYITEGTSLRRVLLN